MEQRTIALRFKGKKKNYNVESNIENEHFW